MTECRFGDCERPSRSRGWCHGHYAQWFQGRPLTPLRPHPVTAPDAELDIEEFEYLLSSGETLEQAVRRVGLCARTLTRRYTLIGKTPPPGLWAASRKLRKEAS